MLHGEGKAKQLIPRLTVYLQDVTRFAEKWAQNRNFDLFRSNGGLFAKISLKLLNHGTRKISS